jgi:hypothetical protein
VTTRPAATLAGDPVLDSASANEIPNSKPDTRALWGTCVDVQFSSEPITALLSMLRVFVVRHVQTAGASTRRSVIAQVQNIND